VGTRSIRRGLAAIPTNLGASVLGLARQLSRTGAANAAGVYAQLVAAHLSERGAAQSAIETQDAALAARIEVAARSVADLDRRLNRLTPPSRKHCPGREPWHLARDQWHELKMTVAGTDFKTYIDGQLALEYTLPEPVSGKIGLWSKTDSTSYFKDYIVQPG
jgi:hypothetical protein